MERLFAFIRKFTGGRQGMLLPADVLKIETLAQKKYRTWRWNFGRSPGYRLKKRSQLKGRRLEAVLEVHSGIIRRVRLTDLAPGSNRIPDLEAVLAYRRHTPSAVLQAVAETPGPFCSASPEEIITALF
jgi:lipoate-protein ligase A